MDEKIKRSQLRFPKSTTGFIYCLKHPTTNEVFWVGQTKRTLEERLFSHLGEAYVRTNVKSILINDLKKMNLKPIIESLEIIPFEPAFSFTERIDSRELFWLNKLKLKTNLLNKNFGRQKGEPTGIRVSIADIKEISDKTGLKNINQICNFLITEYCKHGYFYAACCLDAP